MSKFIKEQADIDLPAKLVITRRQAMIARIRQRQYLLPPYRLQIFTPFDNANPENVSESCCQHLSSANGVRETRLLVKWGIALPT